MGIKKKDRCLSRGFVAADSHCSLRIPVDKRVNKMIMPKTLPGSGMWKKVTSHILR